MWRAEAVGDGRDGLRENDGAAPSAQRLEQERLGLWLIGPVQADGLLFIMPRLGRPAEQRKSVFFFWLSERRLELAVGLAVETEGQTLFLLDGLDEPGS